MCLPTRKGSFFWLLVLVGMVAFPTFSLAATLHAILVGDTNDSSIGISVRVDMERLQVLVQSISEHTGLTLNRQYITGDQLTRENVERTINGASVDSDDVVFFFWNGHGNNAGESVLPTMGLKNGQLGLSQVKTTLSAKNPRLLIVIGDTCNVGREGPVQNRRGNPKPENYRELFLKYRGTILASGSKKGYYSWGSTDGGFYTLQFLDSLNDELSKSGRPSWNDLMSRADKVINVRPGVIQPPQSKVEVSYVENVDGVGGGDSCRLGEPCNNTPAPGANWTCVTPEEEVGNDRRCCQASNGKRECWNVVW
ncbi:MAG: hypothetical protein BWK78_07300 [Thiotrichaceae bacterium IS1]|nr:MAG: hypothetical protein BWK78_07300 [Thiotrichaceae bacterium IS1]